jgi:hypothetical protein
VPEFHYSNVLVHEWVKTPKIVLADKLDWKRQGSRGLAMRVMLQLQPAGSPALLEWLVAAKLADDPLGYGSSLLVDRCRVRGIDYHPISRSYRYRKIVPAGWHQDIDDPIQADHRREPLAFEPVTDLMDFTVKVAKLWNIQLPDASSLL